MKYFFVTCSILLVISNCSQNSDKEFDCDGVNVKFNDFERYFEVGGVDLSSREGFFMNQTTIFGKFYENVDGSAIATFSKINNTLEFTDPNQTLTAQCTEK
ncbi:MAG: hypothetical protein CMH04_00365 [Marinovum sp.]|nr:hypothetical protein [Marinovum sp.]